MDEIRVRLPDGDLRGYLTFVGDFFTLEDIANIYAEVPGHNDDDDWYWIIELKGGRFLLTKAGCDSTGWDCQAQGESQIATTSEEAALLAPRVEDYTGREIRTNLLAQIRGEQPFGLEVRRNS